MLNSNQPTNQAAQSIFSFFTLIYQAQLCTDVRCYSVVCRGGPTSKSCTVSRLNWGICLPTRWTRWPRWITLHCVSHRY